MINLIKYFVATIYIMALIGIFDDNLNTPFIPQCLIFGIILSIGNQLWENSILKKKNLNNEIFLIKTKSSQFNRIIKYTIAFILIGVGICTGMLFTFVDSLTQSLSKSSDYPSWSIHPLFNLAPFVIGIAFLFNSTGEENVCFEFEENNLRVSDPKKGLFKLDFSKNEYKITVNNQTIIFKNMNSSEILVLDNLLLSEREVDRFSDWVLN